MSENKDFIESMSSTLASNAIAEIDKLKKHISFMLKDMGIVFSSAVKDNPNIEENFKKDYSSMMQKATEMQAELGAITEVMEKHANPQAVKINFPADFAKEYLQAKMQNQDKVVMYKHGDYYVMVGEDAEKASHILDMPTQKAALGGSKSDTVLIIPQPYAAMYGDRIQAGGAPYVMIKDTPTAEMTAEQEIEMQIPKEYKPFFNVMKQTGKNREEVREIIANPAGYEHLLPGDIRKDIEDIDSIINETFQPAPQKETEEIAVSSEKESPKWLQEMTFVDDRGEKVNPKDIPELLRCIELSELLGDYELETPISSAQVKSAISAYVSEKEDYYSTVKTPANKAHYEESIKASKENLIDVLEKSFGTRQEFIYLASTSGLSMDETLRYVLHNPKDMPADLKAKLPEDMQRQAEKMTSSLEIIDRGPISPGEAYEMIKSNNFAEMKANNEYFRLLDEHFPDHKAVEESLQANSGVMEFGDVKVLSYDYNFHTIKLPETKSFDIDEARSQALQDKMLNYILANTNASFVSIKEGQENSVLCFKDKDAAIRQASFLNNLSQYTIRHYKEFAGGPAARAHYDEQQVETLRQLRQYLGDETAFRKTTFKGKSAELGFTVDFWNFALGLITKEDLQRRLSDEGFMRNPKETAIEWLPKDTSDAYLVKEFVDKSDLFTTHFEKDANPFNCEPKYVGDRTKEAYEKLMQDKVITCSLDIEYRGEYYKGVKLPLDIERYQIYSENGAWSSARIDGEEVDFHFYEDPDQKGKVSVDAMLISNGEMTDFLSLYGENQNMKIGNLRLYYSATENNDTVYDYEEVELAPKFVGNDIYDNGREEVIDNHSILNQQTEVEQSEHIEEEETQSRGFHR